MKTQIRIVVFSLLTLLCLVWTATASAQSLYNNGPINGTINAYFIDAFQVSDSFTLTTPSNLTSFTFGAWVSASDAPLTVDYKISATLFGANLASGTATLSNVYWGGSDIYQSTANVLADLPAGTYYLTLTNGTTLYGGRMAWDQNNGPSVAYQNVQGQIPSESFLISGNPTPPTPAITARSSGEVDVVTQGVSNELWYYHKPTYNSGPWTPFMIAGPSSAFSAPAIAIRSSGEADVVVEGPSHELVYYSSTGSSWTRTLIGGANTTFSAPSIVVRPSGEVDVIVQGINHDLLYFSRVGSTWSSSIAARANTTFSAPAMVLRPSGELNVVAQGPNNELLYYSHVGSSWSSTVVAPANTTFSAPGITLRSSGEVDVVAQGPGNNLLYYSKIGSIWSVNLVAGPGTIYSSPAISVQTSGLVGIVAQGPSSQLVAYLGNPTSGWATWPLSGGDYSAPSAALVNSVTVGTVFTDNTNLTTYCWFNLGSANCEPI